LDPKDAQVPRLLNKYRIQSHYLVHQCFRPGVGFMPPGGRLAGLPISIVHGKSDWICRPEAALDLHRRLPGSRLHWTNCGHNPFEPANAAAMVAAIAHFANPTHACDP
jgi:proline iminopeptidase